MQIKLPNAIMSVEKMYSEVLSQSDGKYLLSILPFTIEASFLVSTPIRSLEDCTPIALNFTPELRNSGSK